METILHTKQLTKTYGTVRALDQVDLELKRGEIYGLIGPNGAGKTTLLKILNQQIRPTGGEALLFGKKMNGADAQGHRIGALIEAPGLLPHATALQNLEYKSGYLGIRRKGYERNLLRIVGIENAAQRKVKGFSLGMKQRLGIALALVGEPDFLLLDEPINGMDPQGIIDFRNFISQLQREEGITFIISSHILDELARLATRFGFMNEGKLLKEMTAEELQSACSTALVAETPDADRLVAALQEVGTQNVLVTGSGRVEVQDEEWSPKSIIRLCSQKEIELHNVEQRHKTLEDFYLEITGGKKSA